ncbi:serine hydrolase [Bradyrhizobium sp.]|uniref:D-alanyl-D-alanine carboxypeptidase family protein n=1 Tax=Bradyrhizobium sp. TaxID=376 RepID=UPI003C6F944D
MNALRPSSPKRFAVSRIVVIAALVLLLPRVAHAEAHLLIEADSGKVLEAENATVPWYPASLSKLMTAYVTLKAVKDGKITLDTLVTVSPLAASQSPSKMGFRPGTQLTVDNALKMMLVKSANDMAVVLAEGVGGSIDGFAAMMNDTAQKLGMTQTSYVNPNGLPADGQITSARDLAILARAIIHDLPEYEYYVHIPSIRFGRRVTQNFNKLIGRYPGADGFKTGFICASGYNLVASATRDGRRLIAVVLGASSGTMRAVRAAQLLDRGFANNGLSWLTPSLGTVDKLVPIDTTPPNLRDEMCSGKRHKPASDEDDDIVASNPGGPPATGETGVTFYASGLQPPLPKPSELLAMAPAPSEPVVVYTGPTRSGAALVAAEAADADAQTPAKHRGKKARLAARRPDAAEPAVDAKRGDNKTGDKIGDKETDKKSAARPAANRHPSAKADADGKPFAAADPTASEPARPKNSTKTSGTKTSRTVTAAKPATKPKVIPSSEPKPAG